MMSQHRMTIDEMMSQHRMTIDEMSLLKEDFSPELMIPIEIAQFLSLLCLLNCRKVSKR
jgi:hypothetical protein